MTLSTPKLRSDLDVREHRTERGSVLMIKDPLSGEFFRLQEVERFIAEQLDGATSLETVRTRAEEKFGATLAPEALAGFVKMLDRNGLLESEDRPRHHRRKRKRRLDGSALYLRFRFIDPDRLFSALAPRVRWCFTSTFVVLSAILIVGALALTVLNWGEITQNVSRLYALSTLPLLVATIFFVITAHEFGHGLTCKHFGGEVRELGFMLIYFQPAMYCNVSDAWFFQEKSRRLWVGFAGPFLELAIWALATLTWRVTDTETFINTVALVVMATSGAKTLFNFNPLIKLDGYYLLSDWLDIPNLRKKSAAYVSGCLKRVVLLTDAFPAATPRERRIYLSYGLAASGFSFLLLGFVALTVGNLLLEQHQRAAFVAFAGLIGTRARRQARKILGKTSRSSGSRKRHFRFFRRRAPVATGVAALVALLLLGRMELRVSGPMGVLPVHNADVRTEIAGIIDEIFVDEGQHVEAGDLVARLSGRQYRVELERTRAEVQQMEARLELLTAGPTKAHIRVAEIAVMKAEERLQFARAKLARDGALFEQQLLSRSAYDATREPAEIAETELAEARSTLQVLLNGTRPEEIKAAQAELARLQTQRRYLEEQLRLIDVISPATGVVTTPSRQLREMVHQMVQAGDLIAKVFELRTLTVQAAVSEKEIADVRVGQKVALKARAYPNQVFHGKVVEIATTAQGTAAGSSSSSKTIPSLGPPAGVGGSANTILVTTEIDNSADLLKPGMTGMAKIYCGERRLIDLILRRLSLTFRVEFWSWW